MRLLVTGCAGFIGWNVSELLLKEGHSVVGIDNLNNAYDVRLKEWRLSQFKGKSEFSFHRLDITELGALEPIFQKDSFDAAINLAARAGVRQSVEDPWVYYETNVTGTLNLLELCRQHQVSKFILASSSSVYGNGERPFREDSPTDQPLSPYAASKKGAEVLCYTHHSLYALDITALRYFTVYGPASRPDMSPFRFIKWIAEGEPVVIYGDGSQERDFTYVEDIARGTLAALHPVGYEVINLGSDRPVSLLGVIAMLEDLVGTNARIQHQPPMTADVPATWADISKARRVLDWEPQVHLDAGLSKAVDWYLDNREWAQKVLL